MKKIISVCTLLIFLASCATHTHIVGNGASGSNTITKRQLYVLNIVPINDIDTNIIAGDAEDYTIVTTQTFVDGLITAVTGGVISIRSVSVTK